MKNCIKDLTKIFSRIEVSDHKGKLFIVDESIEKITKLVIARGKGGNKVIFIGNGGSASIASHMATDFLKNGNVPAMAFNDTSLITCLSNDLGYEYVFQKPIEMLARKGDILFAISSSGRSKNILNATSEARKKECLVITLSGFSPGNPLRKMGDINFYVPSDSYGYVETVHLIICHCIADKLTEEAK